MPTYDYHCDACGHQFEAFQSMKDDALSVCPECTETALRRIITGGAGVIFRGSGFYVNDSKRSGASSGNSKPSGTATDTGGTTGSDGAKGESSGSTKSETASDSGGASKNGEKKTA